MQIHRLGTGVELERPVVRLTMRAIAFSFGLWRDRAGSQDYQAARVR